MATNMLRSADGVTKPQGKSAPAVRGWHHKKNFWQRMQDRASHTMVGTMGFAIGDPGDVMMWRELEQPEQ